MIHSSVATFFVLWHVISRQFQTFTKGGGPTPLDPHTRGWAIHAARTAGAAAGLVNCKVGVLPDKNGKSTTSIV